MVVSALAASLCAVFFLGVRCSEHYNCDSFRDDLNVELALSRPTLQFLSGVVFMSPLSCGNTCYKGWVLRRKRFMLVV